MVLRCGLLGGLVGENSGLVGEYAGLVGENSGLVGENSGLVGEYAGLVGENSGLVGENSGLVGEYAGLVGEYAGLAGEYAGLVGAYGLQGRRAGGRVRAAGEPEQGSPAQGETATERRRLGGAAAAPGGRGVRGGGGVAHVQQPRPKALAEAIVPRPKGAAYESRVHGFVAETGCDHNFFLLAWTTAAESAKEGGQGPEVG
eukprot:jgi/Tetstr1/466654/TSEL_011142.t1